MAVEDLAFAGGMTALFGAFFMLALVIIFIIYLITALALYKIAIRTKSDYAWLAWVPIANIILMALIAKQEWWLGLIAIFAPIIPFVGGLASTGLIVFFWWRITERFNKPGPLALLMIIPIVNLGYMLYLAFSD